MGARYLLPITAQQYYVRPTTLDSSFSKVLAPLAIAVYNGLHHWNGQDLPVLNPLRSQNQCYWSLQYFRITTAQPARSAACSSVIRWALRRRGVDVCAPKLTGVGVSHHLAVCSVWSRARVLYEHTGTILSVEICKS